MSINDHLPASSSSFFAASAQTLASPALCVVSPSRMRVLEHALLTHKDISLRTLNAPQPALNGTTPLCFLAWLGRLEEMRLLLEMTPSLVAVDARDSLNATPLMCM